jgi:hypothetical protein
VRIGWGDELSPPLVVVIIITRTEGYTYAADTATAGAQVVSPHQEVLMALPFDLRSDLTGYMYGDVLGRMELFASADKVRTAMQKLRMRRKGVSGG